MPASACRTLRFVAGLSHTCVACGRILQLLPDDRRVQNSGIGVSWGMLADYMETLHREGVVLSNMNKEIMGRLQAHYTVQNVVLLRAMQARFDSGAAIPEDQYTESRALVDALFPDLADAMIFVIVTFRPTQADLDATPQCLAIPGHQERLAAAMRDALEERLAERKRDVERRRGELFMGSWDENNERVIVRQTPHVCLPPEGVPVMEWVFVSLPIIVFVAAAAWLVVASADVIISRGTF